MNGGVPWGYDKRQTVSHAIDTQWLLHELREARAEVQRLREENDRLRRELGASS